MPSENRLRLSLARWRVLAVCVAATSVASSCRPPPPPPPSWWKDDVFYEVFVRSFADSDGDGVGDLNGLTAHLDDLNDGDPNTTTDLGVDALWLMPINPSPSYHGYDVTDYQGVNGSYGTLADFDALIAAAHARGIKVILDMVLNHSSDQHPWFQDSQSGAGSSKRDWYVWSDSDLHWRTDTGSDPWHPLLGTPYYYYGYFYYAMPDLNLRNSAVEGALVDSMKFWLSHGADGFRLDAVRYYYESSTGNMTDQPETYSFLDRIRPDLQQVKPDVVLVAEAWANVDTEATYYGHTQLAFAFDQADALKQSAQGGSAAPIINELAREATAFSGKDRAFQAPFLSNHDQVRVMRALAGDPGAARAAAATLFAMPGTPFIYYGEELGMQGGGTSADEDKRTPYHWNSTSPNDGFTTGTPWYSSSEAPGVNLADERSNASSLWNLYRRLINVRHALPALRGSDAVWEQGVSGGGTGLMALARTNGSSRALFIVNFATTSTGAFTVPVAGNPTVVDSEGLTGAPASANNQVQISDLAPRGFAFISLQ